MPQGFHWSWERFYFIPLDAWFILYWSLLLFLCRPADRLLEEALQSQGLCVLLIYSGLGQSVVLENWKSFLLRSAWYAPLIAWETASFLESNVLFSEFFENLQTLTFSTSKMFIHLSLPCLTKLSQSYWYLTGHLWLFIIYLPPVKWQQHLFLKGCFRGKAFPATNSKNEERHKNVHSWNVKGWRAARAVPMLLLTHPLKLLPPQCQKSSWHF